MDWGRLDPMRVERGVQLLLRRKYPGLRSFDGSGGDGGRDAQLITADGRTVFEIKSFGRLDGSRRRQTQKSLRKAVESAPEMDRYVIVVPMNMTPSRAGVKSSEEDWLDRTLPAIAPGVQIEWWGQDWLDSEIADNMDVQRYIEGPDGQLLQRASDLRLEEAALARGAEDVHARLEKLQRTINEVSPFWTLDVGLRDGVRATALRAKTPDAPVLDPITITPTFSFRDGDEELRLQLERTLEFGGRVDLPAGYVTKFEIDASDEARLLIPERDPKTSGYTFVTERVTFDRPIRCSYQVLSADEQVLAEFPVYMRERTNGIRGATVYGSDAADIVKFEVDIPRPDALPEPGESLTMGGTRMEIVLPPTVVGLDIASLLPIYETLAAAQVGTRLRLLMPGLGWVGGGAIESPPFPGAEEIRQVIADLRRMEQVLGMVLRFPDKVTYRDALDLRNSVRLLDGEEVEFTGTFTINMFREGVEHFLATLVDDPDYDGGLDVATSSLNLHVGDLTLPYGASAFSAPRFRLTNRDELEAIAAGADVDEDEVQARLVPTDMAFKWLPREQAEAYLAAGDEVEDDEG